MYDVVLTQYVGLFFFDGGFPVVGLVAQGEVEKYDVFVFILLPQFFCGGHFAPAGGTPTAPVVDVDDFSFVLFEQVLKEDGVALEADQFEVVFVGHGVGGSQLD